MKFNYQATILIGTVALASNFNAGQANASDCISLYVPWKWELERIGTTNISVRVENMFESFSRVPDRKTLAGTYIVKLLFDEPSNYCEKLGNAPTQTTLQIEALFTGVLGTTSVPVSPLALLTGPYARASAYVDILEDQLFNEENLYFIGDIEINQKKAKGKTVEDGSRLPFGGNLDAFAYTGLSLTPFGSSLASAHLDLSATFLEPTTGWVEYKVPTESVPEPLTMLASATAVGFGAFFKRQHSKNQKKS